MMKTMYRSIIIVLLLMIAACSATDSGEYRGKAAPQHQRILATAHSLALEKGRVEHALAAHMISQKLSRQKSDEYASLIIKHSAAYQVDPYLVLAIMEAETGGTYDRRLVGEHGDTGLMQILPSTQKYMGIKGSLFEPSVNIQTGSKYLAYCQKRFGYRLGIVAYNQGEGNVRKGTYSKAYLYRIERIMAAIRNP
ncbi:transglycosylase SLT domain-containing protein [Paenibacillus tengchongensis]|uniref:transglycosylase SLT domain-containing protein n=1 Tax=Paenibacillus tengchongensis TaxID=2608684 RepID=UPI00124E7BF3|nr:transglycosylase SLT domain-containing protein [Paenibacillus tengchongensis]